MKKYLLLVLVVFGLNLSADAQLADGSIGPDFTLTDRDGVEHNLYSYLDQGKAVFIKFFACHCPSCWNYHQTGFLEQLYQQYGPAGTDQIMVLMLEHDENNPEAFTGGGTYTQGDWTAGNSIPMIDVEGATDRQVFTDYNMQWYPLVMKVCPDRTVKRMMTNWNTAALWGEANACAGNLSIDDEAQTGTVYVDNINHRLRIQGFDQISDIVIYNLMGQEALRLYGETNGVVDLSSLNEGAYIVRLNHAQGQYSQKIIVQ